MLKVKVINRTKNMTPNFCDWVGENEIRIRDTRNLSPTKEFYMNKKHKYDYRRDDFTLNTGRQEFYDFKLDPHGFGVSCTVASYYDNPDDFGYIHLVDVMFKNFPELAIDGPVGKEIPIDKMDGLVVIDNINRKISFEETTESAHV